MSSRHRREVTKIKRTLDIDPSKIKEYREAFDMFDKDHSGSIDIGEISKIMKNYGNPMTKEEIKVMIKDIDIDGDGEIDFEEFVTLMEKQTTVVEESDEEAVLRAFQFFDKDHDVKITNYEFRFILQELGVPEDQFENGKVDLFFKVCDLDNDGICNYHDFIQFWKDVREG